MQIAGRVAIVSTLTALGTAQAWLQPRPIDAMPSSVEAEQAAKQFRRHTVDGAELRHAVRKVVKELTWHKRLADAQQAAQAEQKPIFWLQMLGDLHRYT